MLAFLPIMLEVYFVLLKPQEVYEFLQSFRPLYTLPALIGVGYLATSGTNGRVVAAPHLKPALIFFAWTMFTCTIRAPSMLVPELLLFGTPMLMMAAIAHSLRSWKLYEMFGFAMLVLTIFLCFVAVHQSTTPFQCHWSDPTDHSIVHLDEGKYCSGPEAEAECYDTDEANRTAPEPGVVGGKDYVCEHTGLMQTASVVGRVRFRGNLEDPNELSLACAIGLPFAIGFFQRKRSALRFLLLLVSLGFVVACVFFSQSRGGQLTLLVCLGTFFIIRYGWKLGAIVGGIAAVLVIVLASYGGRASGEADASALERTECLLIGVELVKAFPFAGVGKDLFGNYHIYTAHNSYVLAAAENGLPGFAIWSSVIYLGLKIPIVALRVLKDKKGFAADRARVWSGAALASMAGLVAGSFFLSFTYHPILWIYVGVTGALFSCLRREFPEFKVRLKGKEIMYIVGANIALLTVILVYAKIKLR